MHTGQQSGAPGARVRVVGGGGGGGNAVNRMRDAAPLGVGLVAMNTDAKALALSRAHRTVQLGSRLTRGLGAGAKPEVGRAAAEESRGEIADPVAGADVVFVTGGMGGGTCTGASSLVAELARAGGATVVGVVTRPFRFEGRKRSAYAEAGIASLRDQTDTLIVVSNERLLPTFGRAISFLEALEGADRVLLHATLGLCAMIYTPGLINVDLADVRTVLRIRGDGYFGVGEACGPSRAERAARTAIESPLLEDITLRQAPSLLVHVTGDATLSLDEVREVCGLVSELAAQEAEIIFGSTEDASLAGGVRVTVLATGFPPRAAEQPAKSCVSPLIKRFGRGPIEIVGI